MKENEIDLWIANVDNFQEKIDLFKTLLTKQEIERANSFTTTELQMRFILAHGILHTLLMHYLQIKNEKIQFSYNEFGKPTVVGLHFNLSHSQNLALFGFTQSEPIGVDIEHIDQKALEVEDYLFSEKEKETFLKLSPQEKRRAFFHAWTQKEAIIKAQGTGLVESLHHIEIKALKNCSLFSYDLDGNAVAASAVLAPHYRVNFRKFETLLCT